jgi:hypothetical protein
VLLLPQTGRPQVLRAVCREATTTGETEEKTAGGNWPVRAVPEHGRDRPFDVLAVLRQDLRQEQESLPETQSDHREDIG